jgi:hypothetical protein
MTVSDSGLLVYELLPSGWETISTVLIMLEENALVDKIADASARHMEAHGIACANIKMSLGLTPSEAVALDKAREFWNDHVRFAR